MNSKIGVKDRIRLALGVIVKTLNTFVIQTVTNQSSP